MAGLDVGHLKQVMGRFATGVTIVATVDEEGPTGFTAQSFASLSIDPPLVLVCPGRTVTSWPRIQAAGTFCVSILSTEQEAVCLQFATKGADKFAGLGWRGAPVTGAPIIEDSLAWIDCRIRDVQDGGDHYVVVADVLDLGIGHDDAHPLLFYKAGFGRFES